MDQVSRFREAQGGEGGAFEAALAELRAGRKRSHWIWYVFPQIEGLGSSPMARQFGVRGRDEAEAYLRDDVLRERLALATAAVADHLRRPDAPRLDALMGSDIDALKLVSSLTLFEAVARDQRGEAGDPVCTRLADTARVVLDIAAAQGYPRCAFTLARLRDARRGQ